MLDALPKHAICCMSKGCIISRNPLRITTLSVRSKQIHAIFFVSGLFWVRGECIAVTDAGRSLPVCDIHGYATRIGACVYLLPRSAPPLPKLAVSLCREGHIQRVSHPLIYRHADIKPTVVRRLDLSLGSCTSGSGSTDLREFVVTAHCDYATGSGSVSFYCRDLLFS